MANRLKTTYSRLLLSSPFARMAELVDAHDSNSCSERSVGSIPTSGTKRESVERLSLFFVFRRCVELANVIFIYFFRNLIKLTFSSFKKYAPVVRFLISIISLFDIYPLLISAPKTLYIL